MKHRLHIFSLVLAALLCSASLWAVTSTMPTNYYSGADGKTGNALRLALEGIIDDHTNIGYDNLKYLMKYSDTKDADGINVIDIYSDCEYTSGSDALSWISSGDVGAGMNREHTVPQSWFNKETPMVGDAFHIYPTDAKSNNNRSSYLYGELDLTETVTKYTGTSGGKTYHELGGKGTSKWSSSSNPITYTLNGKNYVTTAYYSGTIYEPDDEYKGDIARGYFYMATRYASGSGNANCSNWSGGAFGSENNGLTNYTAELMLKWHRQDPVSEKELIRNEVIYGNTTYNKGSRKQNNRNPFIDYPCLVEYIWGDSVGKNVDIAKLVSAYDASFSGQGCPCEYSTDPAITVSSSSITISPIATSSSTTQTFTVTGANLTGSISIAKSGSSYITVSPTSIPASSANGANTITITYNAPSSAGSHNATLTISSTGADNVTVTINASCATPKTITWIVDGSSYTTGDPTTSVGSGGNVTKLPTAPTVGPSGCTSKVFKGWSETEIGSTPQDDAPSDLFTTTSATACQNITSNKTFYAIFATETTVSGGGTVSDTINRSKTASALGSTATSTWASDFTITGNTGAVYTIHSMGTSGGTHALQWNTNGYLYCSTTNGNKLKSVKVTTLANKNVTIYGNATAYTAKATATQLNTLAATTSGSTYTFTSDYYAIGINGAASSTQVSEIIISYEGGSTTTYSDYVTQCTACTPVAATASYAHSSRTTTCGGSVSNTFTTNSNATVSYSSNNTSVATVASDGTVTPVGQGSATITATVPANTCFTGGASASFTLTVNRNTGTASFSGATTTVNKDATVTNVVTTNSDGAVTYSSSNTSVATVNASGVVTGVSAGTATITANVAQSTCYTAASANYTITVYDFKANAATDVTCESFTANWNTSGAATYSLDVYQGTTGSTTVNRDTTWLNESFASSSQGEFTIDNKSMDSHLSYVWTTTASYGMKGSANISGTAYAAESWLISPVLDLTNATSAKLTFDHTTYAASSTNDLDYLLVYVSSDGGSNWTNLTIPTWPSKRWNFVSSGEIDLTTYASSNVKIAFCYKSTSTYAGTWEIKNVVLTGKYDKTISTSSVEHVTGYPKNVSGTSASVTGLDASTTYKYTVTPQGGSASNEIEVTTPACSCLRTITATSNDDSMGTVEVTLP